MVKLCSRIVALAAVPCLMAASLAVTSIEAASPWKRVDVPFAFRAGDTELAAGTYKILASNEKGAVTIKLEGPTANAEVAVVTRLARTTASAATTNLVFDMFDGTRRLSEVWIAGEDGYLVRGNLAEAEHEHVILSGSESN
jgi:hypothetical protein